MTTVFMIRTQRHLVDCSVTMKTKAILIDWLDMSSRWRLCNKGQHTCAMFKLQVYHVVWSIKVWSKKYFETSVPARIYDSEMGSRKL